MGCFFVVGTCDLHAVQQLELGVSLAEFDPSQPSIVTLDSRRVTDDELLLDCIGAVVVSSEGATAAAGLQSMYRSRFDWSLPAIIDVSRSLAQQQRDEIRTALIAHLLAARAASAQRSVQLMREASQLRVFHEKTQQAFSRLEKFVVEHRLPDRAQSITLSATTGRTLAIETGVSLEQRLPRSSFGLSDVAIFLDSVPNQSSGELAIDLLTVEDHKKRAAWRFSSRDLEQGWLRLSLPVALDGDPMTASLTIKWTGPEPLIIAGSVWHPDRRFQAQLKGKPTGLTLALKTWIAVVGTEVPVHAGGHLPVGTVRSGRVVPKDVLASAVNATPENEWISYRSEWGALQVHVRQGMVAAALVRNVVDSGTTHLSARILTRSQHGPVVDYAMGICPASDRPEANAGIPRFDPKKFTDWHPVQPLELGQLHLYMEPPASTSHDLYLLTRMHDNAQSEAYGWSTFEQIELWTD